MKEKKQITELKLNETRRGVLDQSEKFYFQVDFLKAVMIFLVIFDHIVFWDVKNEIGVALWERISIPVFLVIMGFNIGKSFQRKGDLSLKQLYSWRYFKSKILRYIVPFLILYAFSTLIGLIIYQFNISAMYQGHYLRSGHGFINLFIGFLLFWGPGNWFIPVIIQSILIFPLIYWAFRKKPNLTLILCFAVEFAMQLTVFFLIGDLYPEGVLLLPKLHYLNMFWTSILFYLSAIGLGIWISFNHQLFDRRNLFIWILFPISLAYLILYQFFDFRFRVDNIPLLRGDYHFLVFPYSAVLFLIVMMILPQKLNNNLSRAISLIGKSTYHILLTQILGYGMIFALRGTHYLISVGFTFMDALNLIYAWSIFIPFGILWYKIDQEKSFIRRLLYYINFFLVFSVVVFYIFEALVPPNFNWVPIPFIIILIYAGVALTIIFAVRKPIKTTTLGIWTSFLVYDFFIAILYMGVLPPTEFLIQNISICTFIILAIIGTILDYTFVK